MQRISTTRLKRGYGKRTAEVNTDVVIGGGMQREGPEVITRNVKMNRGSYLAIGLEGL